MKTNQASSRRRSFAGVGRIPETHKKTAPTGPTFWDKRHLMLKSFLNTEQKITFRDKRHIIS